MTDQPGGPAQPSNISARYSTEIANEICHLVTKGQVVAEICARDDMPAGCTVRAWRRRYPIFDARLEVALSARVRGLAEGQPTEFTPEIGVHLGGLLASGRELQDVCSRLDMPSLATLYAWVRGETEMTGMLETVREIRGLVLLDEMLTIADGASVETLNFDKIRVSARQFAVGKPPARKSSSDESSEKPVINVKVVRFGHQNKDC